MNSRGKAVRGPGEGRGFLSVKEAGTAAKSVGSRGGGLRAAWAEGGQAKPREGPLRTVGTWHSCGVPLFLWHRTVGRGRFLESRITMWSVLFITLRFHILSARLLV